MDRVAPFAWRQSQALHSVSDSALLRVGRDEFADLMHVVPGHGTTAIAQQRFHG
jgi:hypothetical protein